MASRVLVRLKRGDEADGWTTFEDEVDAYLSAGYEAVTSAVSAGEEGLAVMVVLHRPGEDLGELDSDDTWGEEGE